MTAPSDHRAPAKRARIHERVSRILLKRIIRGEIPIGARLSTERALAAEFQVNRATVREALRYLENLELIAIRQGDGAYVKNFLESGNLETAKAVMHVDDAMRLEVLTAILEVRRINSPAVAYAAALRRSPDHLARLQQVALHSPDLPILERDKNVHHIIGLASGNILQILMTNFYQDFFYDFGHLYFLNDNNIKRSEAFHRDIYHAIRDQNAGMARDIMRDVLQYAEQAIREEIESPAVTDSLAFGGHSNTKENDYWSNQ
jgi:GntR family transcriptional regulator, transcriptional repressor for pyruvate dehydrogenase complex